MGKGNQLLSFSFSLVPQCHRQDKIRQKIRGNYYDTLLLLAHPGKSAPPSPLGAARNPWPHGTGESFGKSFSNAQSIPNVHRPPSPLKPRRLSDVPRARPHAETFPHPSLTFSRDSTYKIHWSWDGFSALPYSVTNRNLNKMHEKVKELRTQFMNEKVKKEP